MDARAAEAKSHLTLDDEFAALFGDYATPAAPKPEATTGADLAPPRLFRDTFTYATAMIERLSSPRGAGLFDRPLGLPGGTADPDDDPG